MSMEDLSAKIEKILPEVRKPARYTGGEFNRVVKEQREGLINFALCFPDAYEIGMSHLGIKILYHILNSQPDVFAQRCFAPWPDMEAQLRKEKIPLFSLETKNPLAEFDIIGFSLQYELCYTNLLLMLDLSGLAFRREERRETDPLIIAGGPCCFNPAPLSGFIDIFFIGEAEESILEFVDLFRRYKHGSKEIKDKMSFLRRAADIEGLYVPAVHTDEIIKKRYVKDFENSEFFTHPPVPLAGTVHERIVLEIMRGCPNKCNFCQAGFTSYPLRFRSAEKLLDIAEQTYRATGYDDISFCALSSASYPRLRELIETLHPFCRENVMGISLPSLRIDKKFLGVISRISDLNRSGLTFAPEAGTERLRKVINKNIDIDKLKEAVEEAYRCGWRRLKLYFMIGLPTETDADLEGIVEMIEEFARIRKKVDGRMGKISVGISNFIPKAHTPFQWQGMNETADLVRKQDFLRRHLRKKYVDVDFHDVEMSFMEAFLCRADRDAGRVIESAYDKGARFDAWRNMFNFSFWEDAFSRAGQKTFSHVYRTRDLSESLPWMNIFCGYGPEDLASAARGFREISPVENS